MASTGEFGLRSGNRRTDYQGISDCAHFWWAQLLNWLRNDRPILDHINPFRRNQRQAEKKPAPNREGTRPLMPSASELNRLTSDPGLAAPSAALHGTPFYFVSEQRLLDNIAHLREGVRAHYPDTVVSYSVKSNNLAAFVRACITNGVPVEVVSRAEYDYVAALGADLTTTIYNGPAKSAADMVFAIERGSFVNVDSLEELRQLAALGVSAPVGVRVPATLASGKGSRFGIDLSHAETLAEARELVAQLTVTGLHIHHSSHRDAESYGHRLQQLLDAADLLGITDLRTLDLGGGFSSPLPPELRDVITYETASYDEYGETLGRRAAELLGTDGPQLVLEPGIGVLANCATYVTRVTSIKHNGGRTFAVVDGSIFEVNPMRSSVNPPMHRLPGSGSDNGSGNGNGGAGPAQVVGATCMEIDVLGELPETPAVGDLLSIENVGSYTISLAPDFIIPRSPVVSADTGELVRPRSSISAVGVGPQAPGVAADRPSTL